MYDDGYSSSFGFKEEKGKVRVTVMTVNVDQPIRGLEEEIDRCYTYCDTEMRIFHTVCMRTCTASMSMQYLYSAVQHKYTYTYCITVLCTLLVLY